MEELTTKLWSPVILVKRKPSAINRFGKSHDSVKEAGCSTDIGLKTATGRGMMPVVAVMMTVELYPSVNKYHPLCEPPQP